MNGLHWQFSERRDRRERRDPPATRPTPADSLSPPVIPAFFPRHSRFLPRHSRESGNPQVGEHARRAKPSAERSQRDSLSSRQFLVESPSVDHFLVSLVGLPQLSERPYMRLAAVARRAKQAEIPHVVASLVRSWLDVVYVQVFQFGVQRAGRRGRLVSASLAQRPVSHG